MPVASFAPTPVSLTQPPPARIRPDGSPRFQLLALRLTRRALFQRIKLCHHLIALGDACIKIRLKRGANLIVTSLRHPLFERGNTVVLQRDLPR